MTVGAGSAQHAALSPDDWDDPAERRYAERQADLAAECGVDAESRVVETDAAGRVHYLVAGPPERDPVVLLHGAGTHAATWLPMLPALADDYRLYLPDRPGRGLSVAPSYRGRDLRSFLVAPLLELFDDLGLGRPTSSATRWAASRPFSSRSTTTASTDSVSSALPGASPGSSRSPCAS